jgi:hypothetical protein
MRVSVLALLAGSVIALALPGVSPARSPTNQRGVSTEDAPSAKAVPKSIYVSAVRRACMGMIPMMCLQIREKKSDPWQLLYDPIIGFTPEPATEYRLRVLVDELANPPADASSQRWFLDRILERRRIKNP